MTQKHIQKSSLKNMCRWSDRISYNIVLYEISFSFIQNLDCKPCLTILLCGITLMESFLIRNLLNLCGFLLVSVRLCDGQFSVFIQVDIYPSSRINLFWNPVCRYLIPLPENLLLYAHTYIPVIFMVVLYLLFPTMQHSSLKIKARKWLAFKRIFELRCKFNQKFRFANGSLEEGQQLRKLIINAHLPCSELRKLALAA